MDTADGTDAFVLGKRKPDRPRHRKRNQIREMSRKLVESGQIPKKPCLLCGSKKSLEIHHIEPMRPDRFVFLCRACHTRAHRPLYRTITVPRAFGQFSVRPEAAHPREEECRE